MTKSDAAIRPLRGLLVSLTPTGGSLESARPRLFSGAPSGLGCAGLNRWLIYVAVYRIMDRLWRPLTRAN